MGCFYLLHFISGAKNVTETGDPFCNTFCNLNGYYCKNQQKAVKIYDSVWWSYHLMNDEKRGSDNSQRVSNRNNKGKH